MKTPACLCFQRNKWPREPYNLAVYTFLF